MMSRDNETSIPKDELEDLTKGESDEFQITIRRPKRTIIVEPMLIIMSLSSYPISLTMKLFIYDQFKEKIAAETGYNLSDISNGNSTCGNDNTNSSQYIFTQEVQKANAYYNMFSKIASTIPAFFATLLTSPYSDRVGRRIAIILPVATGLAYSIISFTVIFFELSVWYLLIAEFVEGLGGSMYLLFAGIYSYIADITSPETRRFRITIIGIMDIAVAMCGSLVFGYWIDHSGYVWPSLSTLVIRVFVVLYAIFLIPETIINPKKPPFCTLSYVKAGLFVFVKDTPSKRRWQLLILLLAFTIIMLGKGEGAVSTLYELNEPFCWTAVIMGYYRTVYLGVAVIGGTISAKLLGYCASDHANAVLAGFMSTAHYIYKGFCRTTLQLFLTCAFTMFSILFLPAIRTMLSKLVTPTEQGAVFGAVALIEIGSMFVGDLIANAVYANTLWISPGFVYIIFGLIYAIGTSILLFHMVLLRCSPSTYTRLEEVHDKDVKADGHD